jgi:pyruvate,water dikinase
MIEDTEDIFYLNLDEIEHVIKKDRQIDIKLIIKDRKRDYEEYKNMQLDAVLMSMGDELPKITKPRANPYVKQLYVTGCSLGKISGKITIMHEFRIPEKELDIVVVKHTDPGWTPLFGLCKGLIVENGGLLSHAAIISRELGLPCIIGVQNATKILKDGQLVVMDASEGIIKIGA